MTTFTYTAINKSGVQETGTVEAATLYAAGHQLKEQGLTPLDLVAQAAKRNWQEILRSLSAVSLKEKIVFIEDLQTMLKSGIPVPRALRIITKQTRNRRFKGITSDLAASVEAGKSLNEAMTQYPKVFSNIFVTMIKVGEMSGNLDKSLEYLSVQLERDAALRSKTKGAMIYPAVIVSAMIIIGVLMTIFVLPKLTATFKDFNAQLPLVTRIVVGLTDFMAGNAVLVIAVMIGAVAGAIIGLRTRQGKRGFDFVLLRFPIISGIVKKINLARFTRILHSMLKSGIAITEGLHVAADALGNSYYRDAALEAAESVKIGQPLTESLAKNERLFPPLVTQMLEVGEETGGLETIADQLAQHFEADVDNTMQNLSSVIEPLLLLVIGAVVGFLALALISPIYSITQTIQ